MVVPPMNWCVSDDWMPDTLPLSILVSDCSLMPVMGCAARQNHGGDVHSLCVGVVRGHYELVS